MRLDKGSSKTKLAQATKNEHLPSGTYDFGGWEAIKANLKKKFAVISVKFPVLQYIFPVNLSRELLGK
jgi:hypothetical protein